MKEYWYNLSQRERLLATAGIFFLSLYLFYLLVFSPIHSKVNFLSQQLQEKKETLNFMQEVKGVAVSKKKETLTNSNLLSIIANQLNSSKIKKFTYQLQQTGSGDIQLSYDEVPFNQFLSWLNTLQNDYEIQIKQLTAEKGSVPGVVKLMVILSA